MLASVRGLAVHARVGSREAPRRVRDAERAVAAVGDIDHGASRRRPVRRRRFVERPDDTHHEPCAAQLRVERVDRIERRHPVLDDLVQRCAVLAARVVVHETRVVAEVLTSDRLAPARERAARRVVGGHRDVAAVAHPEHRVRIVEMRRTLAFAHLLGRRVLVRRHEHLSHRHVDVLPGPRAVALVQRGEDADGRVDAGVHVRVRLRIVERFLVASTRDHLDPAHLGLDGRRVRGPVAPRSVVSVPGDGRVDEPRVELRELVVSEPHPIEDAGPEVLEQDVRMGDELPDDLDAFGPGQVEREVAFPDVLLDVVRGQRVLAHRREPREVALRRLDLDDVGAEVVQQARAMRPREHAREVEHADAVQRPRLGSHGV